VRVLQSCEAANETQHDCGSEMRNMILKYGTMACPGYLRRRKRGRMLLQEK